MKTLSRRSFIKGTALSALSLGVMGSAIAEETAANHAINWYASADMIVVGGGGAGFCAGIEAAKAGSSVLILEKGDLCGGDTVLSGGMIMVGGSELQKQMGFDDTVEKFTKTEMGYCGEYADADMVREMCMESPKSLQFMMDCGRTFNDVMPMRPVWVYDDEETWAPRTHWNSTEHSGHFTALQQALAAYPNTAVKTKTTVAHLVTNDAGEVIGVKDSEGNCYRANKGVVLATASFGRNKEMSKRYNFMNYWALRYEDEYPGAAVNYQCQTNTGDGIRMAQEIGADLALTSSNCISDCAALSFADCKGLILVNDKAHRFVQESAHWGYLNQMVFQEALHQNTANPNAAKFWIIADQNTVSQNMYLNYMSMGIPTTGAEPYIKMIVKADTIDALAEKTGLPADELKKTVERWNSMAVAGVDTDFGRKNIAKIDAVEIEAISAAPYYAFPYIPYSMGSFGGLRTNINTQVLNTEGKAIPRLYAAGAIMSGMYTAQFYNACGWSILGTVHWGRKAGMKIAALAPWTADADIALQHTDNGVKDAIAHANGSYNAGTYTGTAKGRNGDIPVTVTFSDRAIVDIAVGENTETPGIGTAAIDGIPQRILKAQSAEVDTFTGATITADAIIAAVKDCIAQAKK